MRKRQWKKILSVVLALAMVFSMNVSAFADEVTDPVAVEEPAAEEPAPAAEAEEPAAAEEEPAPAAEEAAPEEEAAPADAEEPAGTAVDLSDIGWSTDIEDSTEGSYNDGLLTITDVPFGGALDGTSATSTLRVKATIDGVTLTLTKAAVLYNGQIDTTGTFALTNGTTYTFYRYESAGTLADVMSFEDSNNAGKIQAFYGITPYASDGTAEVTGDLAASTTYLFVGSSIISGNSTPAWSIASDPTDADLSLGEDEKIDIDSDANNGEYYIAYNDSTEPGRDVEVGTLDANGKLEDWEPDQGAGKYYAWVRNKATTNSTFSSNWVATDPAFVTHTIPVDENTVSGLKFTVPEDAKISKVSDNKGIYTVTVEKGEVEVEYENDYASQKAISINVAEGATLKFTSGAKKVNNGSKISIQGSGTILVNPLTGDPITSVAFASVAAGVKVSGNGVNILISSNDAAEPYSTVLAGDEVAYTVKTAGPLVPVALTTTIGAKGWGTHLDDNNQLLPAAFASSAHLILSENKVDFSSVAADANITVSDSRIEGKTVLFGGRELFFNSDAQNTLAGATVIDVPKQSTSQWLKRIIPGMETSYGIDVSRDTDQAILVDEDGEPDEYGSDYKFEYYEFVLSTNSSAETQAAEWGDWIDADYSEDGPSVWKVIDGEAVKPNTKYYLYARRKATSKEYKSRVEKIGEFTTLKETSVSIDLANKSLSPNYIGDASDEDVLETLKDRTDVINGKFFNFKLNGFEAGAHVVDGFGWNYDYTVYDGYDDNYYTVVDSDNIVLGHLYVNYGYYNSGHAPANIIWTDSKTFYELDAHNDGKEKYYAARVSFIPDSNAPTMYTWQDLTDSSDEPYFSNNLWRSGTVSFNVIKAPVKVEPDIQSPAVSGQAIITKYKATNKITGQTASLTGAPLYLFNNQRTDAASWNTAGKSVFPTGKHTVTVSGEGLTSSNYEIDPKINTAVEYGSQELVIVDPNGADGLKVTGALVKDVYYGTDAAGVKDALSANFTFGGVGITEAGDKIGNVGKIKILASESSNVAGATELTETEKISANTTIYAYYIDAQPTKTGYEDLKASSNAIPIKIQPRKVEVNLKGGEAFKTKRGDDLITKISSNKLVVNVLNAGTHYKATDIPDPAGVDGDKFFTAADVAVNTSRVNKNKPGDYDVTLAGYTVSSTFVQNYVVDPEDGDKFNYKVDGRYWVKYILEYGGQGAKTGKRYVSEDVIDFDDVVLGTSHKVIKPSDKISNSWNGLLAAGDEITGWKIKRSDTLATLTVTEVFGLGNGDINTFGDSRDVYLDDYDFAVFAVVSAKATSEGVMVESITPVQYDGLPHVVDGDGSATKNSDITVILYDTNEGKTESIPTGDNPWNYFNPANYKLWKENEKGKDIYAPYLVKGVDYTLTYKNNKNASVAYDETVSGNEGVDATFKRIVTDAKMPQVIVKGKGDYKSLKTTVLFDILPTTYNVAEPETLTLQLAGKNLNTKANVFKVLPKKLDSDGDYPAVAQKTYKLKAGKYNEKKGAYTGDYVMEVYKQAENGARTLLGNAKDLKKVAAGKYILVFKGVNNFRGNDEVEIEVKDGVLLSKQKFKWTKKVNWAEKVTVADFKIKATTAKKPKTDIPLVKFAEEGSKAGYYVSSIVDNTRNNNTVASVTWLGAIDPSDYVFADAGTYTINIKASTALGKSNSIFGSHSLKVEVKGTKLKASDFTIEGKPANKTVVIDYDGQSTKAPVAVALKKASKFPVDEKSKIPMAYGSKKYQAGSGAAAMFNVGTTAPATGAAVAPYIRDLGTAYLDNGVEYKPNLVKSGVYSLDPAANNSRVFSTYTIRITPTGKYYGSEADGTVRLTYKRGNVDLKKAVGSIIKVTSNPVDVNINGTYADLWMTIEGMTGAEINPSDNKVYFHNVTVNGKQYMFEAFEIEPVLEVTYSKNKKVGTGTATLKPTKFGKKYFKGTAKIPFTIKAKTVKPIVEDYDDSLGFYIPGDVLAVVNDVVAPKSGTPKASATLYQVSETGDKVTKLGKKDYTITTGTYDKEKGYPVLVAAGTTGNFKFENEKKEAKAPTESYFNTFGKKAKKIVVTLSQGEASGYDAAKKGYVYTGSFIDPKVVSVTVDGQPLSIPAAGVSTSSNFAVKYNNDVKVGTATATITLKRDFGLSENVAYPVGGTAVVKYKIVPHTNNNLILNK